MVNNIMKKKDIFDKIMELPFFRIFEPFYKKYKEILLYLFFWYTYNGSEYCFLCDM